MARKIEKPVRLETLATAAGVALNSVRRGVAIGEIPKPDGLQRLGRNSPPAVAWRLSTIRRWNPAVAARCAAILDALENLPRSAA